MWKKILSVVIGIFSGMIVITIVEAIGHMVYPLPADINPYDPEAIRLYLNTAPIGALLFVLLAWATGSFLGGWLAAIIANQSVQLVAVLVGILLMAAGIYNMLQIQHPLWFMIIGALIFIPAAYAGSLLVNKSKTAAVDMKK